jgi:VWFA-related protein
MKLVKKLPTLMLIGTVAVVLIALPGLAQQNPEQPSTGPVENDNIPAPRESAPSVPQMDSAGRFSVNVNVVNLFFTVKDKHGTLVPNLPQDDFQVLEDGKPQTVKYFKADAVQPLTLGLLIDTSGSEGRMLVYEQEVASQFISQVLKPKDLAFLISFDVNVDLLQDLTAKDQELRAALRRTRINTGGGGGIPGLGGGPIPQVRSRGTLLYDAVYLASDEKLKHEVGRKAMVILTDGFDEGSQTKLGEAIEAAQKADTIVYVLLIYDPMFPTGSVEMRRMAQETGGRMIPVGNSPEKLKKALQEVSQELRSQYYIGYTPTNRKTDGAFRKVEVRAKSNEDKVQARKGYYAAKE